MQCGGWFFVVISTNAVRDLHLIDMGKFIRINDKHGTGLKWRARKLRLISIFFGGALANNVWVTSTVPSGISMVDRPPATKFSRLLRLSQRSRVLFH